MADKSLTDKLRELTEKLKQDRLIKIYIRHQVKPYLVQEAVLAGLSESSVRALKHEGSLGTEEGVLRFPEDDQTAWDILLDWIIERAGVRSWYKLEDTDAALDTLTRCWVLGDKYDIKTFQDIAMLESISITKEAWVPLEVVKYAFENTAPKSVLRNFMAEETALRIKVLFKYNHEDLGMMDGIPGFTTELLQALDGCKDDHDMMPYHERRTASDATLSRYMVGGKPSEQWVVE